MSYLVLARKYRPQSFTEVVGQQHVTRTLANAIKNNRVAHALLFAGPRGTGKTTVARILAKAMNCEKGTTPQPCNQCRSCLEVTAGNAVDVFEIDGASNNSVDQVRELRENVRYMPARSRFKIYIIDEVHMLSVAAFNALLKTLEEPPEHVMFMFATTEAHKIPVTILSRCQRYDFRRIPLAAVVEHLKKLCGLETFTASEQGLWRIAQEAGGSMRDALSLLDQVMACSDGHAEHGEVMDILGVIDRRVLFDISAAVFRNDLPAVLTVIDEVYDRGHEMDRFFADLVEHFRNLMVAKMAGDPKKLVDLPATEIEQMKAQVTEISVTALDRIFDLMLKEEAAVKLSLQPRLSLEMVFIRILRTPPALPIDVLIEKLDRLGKQFHQTPQRQPPPPRPEGGSRAFSEKHEGKEGADLPESGTDVNRGTPAQVEPRPESPTTVPDDAPGNPEEIWERIVGAVSQKSAALTASLSKSQLAHLGDHQMEIRVNGNGFHLNMIRREKHLKLIDEICCRILGRSIKIIVTRGDADADGRQQKAGELQRLKREAFSHPRVMDVLEIFKGRIVDVKILQEETR